VVIIEISIIASGSNGNSFLVESKHASILIDAGKSGKEIQSRMNKLNKNPEDIDAILVSHEHSDHTRGVGILSRRFNIPVYITKSTYDQCAFNLGKLNEKKLFNKQNRFSIKDIDITPVKTMHDASDSTGFVLKSKNKSFGILTDTGIATPEIKDAIKKLDAVAIESNYDVDMLIKGPYPYHLKNRILSQYGHLSNIECAQLIKENRTDNLKEVVLSHLSGNNNTPKQAELTFKKILASKKFNLTVASRDDVTGSFRI